MRDHHLLRGHAIEAEGGELFLRPRDGAFEGFGTGEPARISGGEGAEIFVGGAAGKGFGEEALQHHGLGRGGRVGGGGSGSGGRRRLGFQTGESEQGGEQEAAHKVGFRCPRGAASGDYVIKSSALTGGARLAGGMVGRVRLICGGFAGPW